MNRQHRAADPTAHLDDDHLEAAALNGPDGYPNIPARVDAVCQAIADAGSCCGLSPTSLVAAFTDRLRSRPHAGPVPAIRAALAAHGCTHVQVDVGEVTGTLNDAVAAWTVHGVDASAVANEVVVAESEKHLGLVRHEINKVLRHMPDACTSDELLGYGWRGLQGALRGYDVRMGYKFSSFACPKINGAIRDGVRSESHLSKRLTTLQRKVERATAELANQLTRAPTFDEIADYLNLSTDHRHRLPLLPAPKHLDEDPMVAEHVLVAPDEWSPEAVVESAMRSEAVAEALSSLDEQAAHIVSALYLHGRTVKAVAADTGLSQRQLRAIRDGALADMKMALAGWDG